MRTKTTMRMTPEARASAALLALSALTLTACSSSDPAAAETAGAPYAAVSTEESAEAAEAAEGMEAAAEGEPSASSAEGDAAESDAAEGDAAEGDAAEGGAAEAEEAPAALSEEEILELLLDEEEMPLEVLEFAETTGTEYFHERMGVNQGVYTEGFGESECAAAMDAVNVDLIGDDPLEGVIREVGYADGSLALWMLSYDRPADSAQVWEDLLGACEGTVLENETETAEFAGFSHGEFGGMSMQMDFEDGSTVEGWFATVDYGDNLVMISAINVDQSVFEQLVEAQADKLPALDRG